MSWSEKLKSGLRSLGLEFESEAEAIRITLPKGSQLEITEPPEGEGLAIVLSVPLPAEGPDDPEYYIGSMAEAMKIILSMNKNYKYEVDESIPGYPLLRIRISFSSGDELAETLLDALEKVFK